MKGRQALVLVAFVVIGGGRYLAIKATEHDPLSPQEIACIKERSSLESALDRHERAESGFSTGPTLPSGQPLSTMGPGPAVGTLLSGNYLTSLPRWHKVSSVGATSIVVVTPEGEAAGC